MLDVLHVIEGQVKFERLTYRTWLTRKLARSQVILNERDCSLEKGR